MFTRSSKDCNEYNGLCGISDLSDGVSGETVGIHIRVGNERRGGSWPFTPITPITYNRPSSLADYTGGGFSYYCSSTDIADMGHQEMNADASDTTALLRQGLEDRTARLGRVNAESVRLASYGLLNAPSHFPPLQALSNLARALGAPPLRMRTVVDDQANPWTEYILLFVDTLLVLYQSIPATDISSLPNCPNPELASSGDASNLSRSSDPSDPVDTQDTMPVNNDNPNDDSDSDSDSDDETDRKSFGAISATSLAPRLLILIPQAHHHVIKSLWFALTYLSIAYHGSKRGWAITFLLDRVYEDWDLREEKARNTAVGCWGRWPWEKRVENEWYTHARLVGRIMRSKEDRKKKGRKSEKKDQMSLEEVWKIMKGMERGDKPMGGDGGTGKKMPHPLEIPSQEVKRERTPPSATSELQQGVRDYRKLMSPSPEP